MPSPPPPWTHTTTRMRGAGERPCWRRTWLENMAGIWEEEDQAATLETQVDVKQIFLGQGLCWGDTLTIWYSLIDGMKRHTWSRKNFFSLYFPLWKYPYVDLARFPSWCQSRGIWLEKSIPLALRASIMNGRYNQTLSGTSLWHPQQQSRLQGIPGEKNKICTKYSHRNGTQKMKRLLLHKDTCCLSRESGIRRESANWKSWWSPLVISQVELQCRLLTGHSPSHLSSCRCDIPIS